MMKSEHNINMIRNKCNVVSGIDELQKLVGFQVESVQESEEKICFIFENDFGVRIDVIYADGELYINQPYALKGADDDKN